MIPAKPRAMLYAILAAVFYAINIPLSKILLSQVGAATMAALLYLGAGIGIAGLSLLSGKEQEEAEHLTRTDLPFVIGMIVLDIAAPILLMLGIEYGTSASASLLGNFEIVATTVIAVVLFRELVSVRLWLAIGLITLSSVLLSLQAGGSLQLSSGSVLVVLATVCWGFENNCTRRLSDKNTYHIVIIKGIFSGLGALAVAMLRSENRPPLWTVPAALVLGFVAYGLSIFLYVRAQAVLGAAKTGAFYATGPFVAAFLSFVFLREALSGLYLIALVLMVIGAVLVAVDTLMRAHEHPHRHIYTHVHNGVPHTHMVTHSHPHRHYTFDRPHRHRHTEEELEAAHRESPH